MNTAPIALLRRRLEPNDRGSMAMVMVAIIVSVALGGLILSMIVSQTRSTRFDTTRVHALHAAQSGLDVVMGEIRASTTVDRVGAVIGDDNGLPCGPVTGNANGVGNGAYSVTISYYVSDPSTVGATPMVCVNGYGPYDANARLHTPRYAKLTSLGTDGSGADATKGRTLTSTYVLQTDDVNIPGGQVKIYPSTSTDWCMDAGSASPTAGTTLLLQVCSSSTPSPAQQVFAYRSDLSIQLVSSVNAANPAGLCIDTSSATHATGTAVVLNNCGVADPTKCTAVTSCSPWNQQWSVDDNAHLEGTKPDKSDVDKSCINVPSQASGVALAMSNCAGGTSDTHQTWLPAITAGAGMAGPAYQQLVNYKQFATCLDVTGKNVTSSYLILYTCKQGPDPTKPAYTNTVWNQQFSPSPALAASPTKVLLRLTATNGTVYCLKSPLTAGGYVTLSSPCPTDVTSASSSFVWTMSTTKAADGTDLPYAQRYTVVDGAGLCLGLGGATDLYNNQYLKAVSATCDGSTAQKWNASPSLDAAMLTNTRESP